MDNAGDIVLAALAESLAQGGMMLTGFVSFVEAVDEDGEETWAVITHPDQSLRTTLGQVTLLTRIIQDDVQQYLNAVFSPDEDD